MKGNTLPYKVLPFIKSSVTFYNAEDNLLLCHSLSSEFHVISGSFLAYDNQGTVVEHILFRTDVTLPYWLKSFLQDWTWIQPEGRQFLYANGSCRV